jgi:hypothetical protein
MVSIHWLTILEVKAIVSIIGQKKIFIHWLKIFFLLTTGDLINVFCRQLIIGIDPIDDFFGHRCPPLFVGSSVELHIYICVKEGLALAIIHRKTHNGSV